MCALADNKHHVTSQNETQRVHAVHARAPARSTRDITMGAETAPDGVTTAATPAGYVNRDELLSLRVVTGAKRVFLALCENERGRYLKLSDGRSKLIVPGSGIKDLRAAIDALHHAAAAAGATTAGTQSQSQQQAQPAQSQHSSSAVVSSAAGAGTSISSSDGAVSAATHGNQPEPIHSERFISEGRKFYLDLLENARGRYVKMSQATTRRISMIFPAAGLPLLRQAMDRLHELAPPDTNVTDPSSAQRITRTVDRQTSVQGSIVTVKAVQRELRVEGKRVIFESGANRRGSYLRITESNGAMKMSVTLPHSTLPQVIDLLREVQEAGDPADELRAAEAAAMANAASSADTNPAAYASDAQPTNAHD